MVFYQKGGGFMLINFDFNIAVTAVVSANRLYNYASDQAVHQKNRKRWAVVLKNTGATYYFVGGKQILSDRNHPVILPCGCDYSWKCVAEGECLLVEFDAPGKAGDIFPFEVADSGFIVREFYQLQRILAVDSPTAAMEAKYRLYGLLLQLFKTVEYVPREKKQLLQPAAQYMLEHYHDQSITNDYLAGLCGISTVYFRKCFENTYGVPPIRYLHNYRIQKAKDLLGSDYGTISQVAESTGYSSVYHFSKMFRQYTGQSPTAYVKGLKK